MGLQICDFPCHPYNRSLWRLFGSRSLQNRGQMDLVKFFSDFSHIFPTLWILIQCLASIRVVEVGCERFFSLSGYISSPLRTQLGVRTYERLAMLASIVQNFTGSVSKRRSSAHFNSSGAPPH